jgi:hypothetical protein
MSEKCARAQYLYGCGVLKGFLGTIRLLKTGTSKDTLVIVTKSELFKLALAAVIGATGKRFADWAIDAAKVASARARKSSYRPVIADSIFMLVFVSGLYDLVVKTKTPPTRLDVLHVTVLTICVLGLILHLFYSFEVLREQKKRNSSSDGD